MTITEHLNFAVNGLCEAIAHEMGISNGTLSNWLQVYNRRSNFDIDRLFNFFDAADRISIEKRGAPAMDGARLFIISNLTPKKELRLNNDVSDELHRLLSDVGRMGQILAESGGGDLNRMHPEKRKEYMKQMGLVLNELIASAKELGFEFKLPS